MHGLPLTQQSEGLAIGGQNSVAHGQPMQQYTGHLAGQREYYKPGQEAGPGGAELTSLDHDEID